MNKPKLIVALVAACALGIAGSAIGETSDGGQGDGYQGSEGNAKAERQKRREQRRADRAEERRARRQDRAHDARRNARRDTAEERRRERRDRQSAQSDYGDGSARHARDKRYGGHDATWRRDGRRPAHRSDRGHRSAVKKHRFEQVRRDRRKTDHGRRWADHRSDGKRWGFDDRVDRRLSNQRARTRDGWKKGTLTHRELKRIRQDRRKITRMDRRFSSDGHYSRREKRKLNKAMDRASKRIYRAKHNHRIADARRPRAFQR